MTGTFGQPSVKYQEKVRIFDRKFKTQESKTAVRPVELTCTICSKNLYHI